MVDAKAELLMVFAARAQHLAEVIKPALARGAWVLTDRFTDATYAYQGYGRGLSVSVIEQLEQLVQEGLQPDVTFLLDIDVELGLKRAKARADLDRFESEKIDFFERVRAGYVARAQADSKRFKLVDAGKDLEQVQAQIKSILTSILN
jgi:dTMP kinase